MAISRRIPVLRPDTPTSMLNDDLDTLVSAVNDAQSDADSNAGDITTNASDIASLDTRVTAVEGQDYIDSQGDDISSSKSGGETILEIDGSQATLRLSDTQDGDVEITNSGKRLRVSLPNGSDVLQDDVINAKYDDTDGEAQLALNRATPQTTLHVVGAGFILPAPASHIGDGSMDDASFTLHLSGDDLVLKVKKANGTVNTYTLTKDA